MARTYQLLYDACSHCQFGTGSIHFIWLIAAWASEDALVVGLPYHGSGTSSSIEHRAISSELSTAYHVIQGGRWSFL